MSRPSIFDAEFRARACELVASSSKPRSQIAADLGVSDATLYNWMTKSKTPENPSPDDEDEPLTPSERAELKRLRKARHVWEMEREILKKCPCRWRDIVGYEIVDLLPADVDVVWC